MARKKDQAPDLRVALRNPEQVRRCIEATTQPEFHVAAHAASQAADTPDGYLAWRKFCHRPPVPGWTAEELWLLTKWKRQQRAQTLPGLTGRRAQPYFVVDSDPLKQALHRIDTLAGISAQPRLRDRASAMDRLQTRVAIDEAWSSSAIEGAVTTRAAAREMIESGRKPASRSDQMVLNNYAVMRKLREWVEQPLSPELLLELQALITQGTLDDEGDAGVFRSSDDVRVFDASTQAVVHIPPPVGELEQRLDTLCSFANRHPSDSPFVHPIIKAIALHHQIGFDHPFKDGNGRTARALFLWSALRSGYDWMLNVSPSRAIYKQRSSYYQAFIDVAQDDGDLTYFVRHQLRCLEQEVERLARFIERETGFFQPDDPRPVAWRGVNQRQLTLLRSMAGKNNAAIDSKTYQRLHSVSQATASNDLGELVDRGLLSAKREGRPLVYRPTDGLRRHGVNAG